MKEFASKEEFEDYMRKENAKELYKEILSNLKKGKYSKYIIKRIAKYLFENYHIRRSKTTKILLKLDTRLNAYVPIDEAEFRDLLYKLHFHLDDDEVLKLEKSIALTVEPTYNVVHFNNCLFDMNTLECLNNKGKNPIYCLTKVPYNYTTVTARDPLIKKFLYSSFEQDTDKIRGVLEIIGYLLTDGNIKERAFFFTGIAGSGKSTLGNIISALIDNRVGIINTGDLNNTHHTSNLLGKKLCMIEEPEKNKKFNDFLKSMVGQSDLTVNPKGKQEITIPQIEKPIVCMFSNKLPFKVMNKALLQKIVLITFNKSFRRTDEQIENLHSKIVNDRKSMEWLIYHSLLCYKDLVDGKREFYWSKNEEETEEAIDKYGDPIAYFLENHFKISYDYYNQGWDSNSDFINMYGVKSAQEISAEIIEWGTREGVEIPTKKGKIHGVTLSYAIKRAFMLEDTFMDDYGRIHKHNSKLVDSKHHHGSYFMFLIPK